MTGNLKVIVGRRYQDDIAAFKSAWQRAELGETVVEERVLSFEYWEDLSSVLTGERFRLLETPAYDA